MRVRIELVVVMFAFNLTHIVTGALPCQDTLDCAKMNLAGYTCIQGRCVCDPSTDTGLFPCRGRMYGDKCRSDYDCAADLNLVCLRNDRTCRCHRGYDWSIVSRICYIIDEDAYGAKFDPVRDLIIPGIIVMTVGALVYLGIKLFCNCGKLWRRRRRQLTRELDEASHQQQATWVASYRVFSSLNGMETRSSPVLSPSSSFPLHPTPCMGLFLPSGSLTAAAAQAAAASSATSPPPYEEALKHKVILSSYAPGTAVILPATSMQQPQPPQGPMGPMGPLGPLGPLGPTTSSGMPPSSGPN